MIPENAPDKQPPSVTTPDRPCICPHCGHRHQGFDAQASTVLDCLDMASQALREAKRLVEAEVLP